MKKEFIKVTSGINPSGPQYPAATHRPKPIGITFNPHNSQLIVLCDDGSIWFRMLISSLYKWIKQDEFPAE